MGRPWGGGKPTPGCYFKLDVRWLKRQGMLRPGARSWVRETYNGQPRGSLHLLAGEGETVITINGQRQWIALAETPVHLGGARPWFVCGCGRRAAVLYGYPTAGRFACRECRRVAYPSQSEDPRYRPTRRAQAIRMRLGGDGNLSLPFPPRPKGMHRMTYDRAWARALQHQQRGLAGMMATVERLRSRSIARE